MLIQNIFILKQPKFFTFHKLTRSRQKASRCYQSKQSAKNPLTQNISQRIQIHLPTHTPGYKSLNITERRPEKKFFTRSAKITREKLPFQKIEREKFAAAADASRELFFCRYPK